MIHVGFYDWGKFPTDGCMIDEETCICFGWSNDVSFYYIGTIRIGNKSRGK